MVPILMRMKVLTEADGMALSNLCQSFSRMARAEKQMRKLERDGEPAFLIRGSAGSYIPNPLLKIIRNEVDIQQKLFREFGLTPSSRTRVETNPEQRNDPLTDAIAPRKTA